MNRWIGRGMAWIVRKLVTRALGVPGQVAAPGPQPVQKPIQLHRDPYCGTFVSPEVSFPLEQAGQTLHFCSAECRARYQASSRRAASA